MPSRYPGAVLLSAVLHGLVLAALLFAGYWVGRQVKESPRIIELVAGEGDNYGAHEAPALGTPGGVKLDPPPPLPKSEPAPVPPAPPAPAAAAPAEAVPPPPKPVDPASKITKTVQNIERRDRANTRKIQQEEEKKAKEEAARQAMTKEQYDKLNKGKSNPTAKAAPPAKIPLVDAAGIAKGVIGGSTANTKGGAGGKALTSQENDEQQVYYAAFRQRLHDAFELPPGVSDTLMAKVVVTISADGRISGARIERSSGNEDYDRAVLAAVARVHMGPRPDHRTEQVSFDFKLHDTSGN
ncbi:MAG TPA: energy transducer TonB [Opitutaceae bacterium]|nr:energy transducer TonB [Opitutaceae bacterium]